MQQQFQQMGLKPGNPDGTYLQNVPLAGITSKSHADIAVKGKKLSLADKKDYIALSSRYAPEVDVKDSDIVFVGYGVVAPEYGWDDYKDVDVKGKTILMLINDPADSRSQRPLEARRQNVQGRGHDLLRPLDLQVRNRLARKARPRPSSFTRPARPAIRSKWSPEAGAARTSASSVPTTTWAASPWKAG